MTLPTKRRSHVEADRPLARKIGARLRRARTQAGLTQAQLAAGRYTKAYVSALENGLVKPSMAALNFFSGRLHLPIEQLISDQEPAWTRLEADLRLAAGDWQEAVDAYSALLDSNPPERSRAEILLGLAEGLSHLGRGQDVVRVASEAAALFRSQGRNAEASWATYWQSAGLYELEQGDQAVELLKRQLDEIAAGLVVEPDLPVRILIALAMNAGRDEEPERALAYLEQARSRIAELDDRKHAVFLFSLALSYRELGDFEAAVATGTASLAKFRAAEAGFEAASIQNELALVYLALGSLDLARSHAAEARVYFEARENTRWLAHVTDTQGQIELAAGATADAMNLSVESIRLAEESGNRKAVLDGLLLQARAQRAVGDLAAAATTLDRAATLAEAQGRRGQLQAVLGEWSDVMAALGDLAQAYALSRRALDAGRH
jgi:transcriptional regulator with XRE-family HTH domain